MAIHWKIDPVHSEIQFRVKHLMITTVTGFFKKFDLKVETQEEDFLTVNHIVFTADIDSIDTNHPDRDMHLKSSEFFHAAEYPQLRFESGKFEISNYAFEMHGDLTIRDVTKPVVFHVEYGGMVIDPYGQTKAGFTVEGKISRKEFGLTWNSVTETGNIVVGDEIKIHAEVQLIKQEVLVNA